MKGGIGKTRVRQPDVPLATADASVLGSGNGSNAGAGEQELCEVSSVQREIIDEALIDHRTQLGRGALDQRRCRGDLYSLGNTPELERHVRGGGLVNTHDDTTHLSITESSLGDADTIRTRLDVNEQLSARIIGGTSGHNSGSLVGQLNCRSRNGCARTVPDRAIYLTGCSLCMDNGGQRRP